MRLRAVPSRAAFAASLFAIVSGCGLNPVRGVDHSFVTLDVALGVDLPLSGIDAASAVPVRDAIALAVEDANAKGLPGNVRLRVEDLDDTIEGKHDPAQGAQNAKTLVADDAVVAMVGPMNSSVAKAQIPVTSAAGLAQISMAATAVELTIGPQAQHLRANGATFFRVCANDQSGGTALAEFAHSLHFRKVFIVDDNESYGKGLADVFESAFTARGGSVLGHEHLTPLQLDFKALLTKIGALHPDAVFFGGVVSTGGGIFRKQMGDAGLGGVPYLGGDGLLSPDYATLAGRAAEGTYFSVLSPNIERLPAARSFIAAFRKRYDAEPSAYATEAYAASQVAIAAIRRELAAHPGAMPARAAIARDIESAPTLQTVVGSVSFDAAGDVREPIISLYRITGGKVVYLSQIAAR